LSLPDLEWIDQSSFGSPDIPEACTAVAIGSSSAVVIGSTEKGGLYTDQGTNNDAQQYGFVMNVGLQQNAIGNPLSGVSLQTSRIQSPISVTISGSHVFVASISSNDSKLSSDPNLTSRQQYGPTTYGTLIHKFTLDGSSLNHNWMQQVSDSSTSNVYVGGLLVKENILLIVGSTTGEEYWEDGYITKHDLDTGDLAGSQSQLRHMWGEILTSICDDPNDPDSFYVVGTGRTSGDLFPSLNKISLDTLSSVWTESLRPINPKRDVYATAHGLACQVSGDMVYVAGTVEDGAHLANVHSSGSDDIFVAQFQSASGSLNWIQQVGSSEKDTLAHGVGLAVDAMGNAILYGSTNGSFFREKEGESHTDIFVATFQKSDGSHASLFSGNSQDAEASNPDYISDDKEDTPSPVKAPTGPGGDTETTSEANTGPSDIERDTTISPTKSPKTQAPVAPPESSSENLSEEHSLDGFWVLLYVPGLFLASQAWKGPSVIARIKSVVRSLVTSSLVVPVVSILASCLPATDSQDDDNTAWNMVGACVLTALSD
jgi:hypothetical protein